MPQKFTEIFVDWKEHVGPQLHLGGIPRRGQPTRACQEAQTCPGGLCLHRFPSPVGLGCRNSYLLYKNSSQSFVPFRELLFLHKNNTMVVLLKTSSDQGQFHSNHANQSPKQEEKREKKQILWRRINSPSLNLCLSSSNSVDKLKVRKKKLRTLLLLFA